MNSGKQVKNEHELAKFEKAKQKVVSALEYDPFGLTISQLMTVCQLSAKTVKEILANIDIVEDCGVFTLKDHVSPDLSSHMSQQVVIKKDRIDMPTTSPQAKKPTYIQRMVKMFKDYPNGISKNDALYILGGSADMFATMLKDVRKYHFAVELVKQSDGEKLYIPQFDDVDQTLPVQSENVPVAADALPNADEAILHKNEDLPHKSESETPDPEYFEHKTEYLPDLVAVNDIEKAALLECKNMVQTQTFQKSEVYLDLDQINILLKQIFDLSDVKWRTTGARVDGVHLSKVQAI